MAVWESCRSRQCILDYLLAVQQVSTYEFFCQQSDYVKRSIQDDPAVQSEWISLTFENDENQSDLRNNNNTTIHLKKFLSILEDNNNEDSSISSLGTASTIESLCASIKGRQYNKSIKPTTPNGYYGGFRWRRCETGLCRSGGS
jgi:hypothetical protein